MTGVGVRSLFDRGAAAVAVTTSRARSSVPARAPHSSPAPPRGWMAVLSDEPLFDDHAPPERSLATLSPRVMRVGGDESSLGLLDMRPVSSFWGAVSVGSNTSLTRLWLESAERVRPTVICAIARSPFQAMILARFMRERDFRGVIDIDSPFGQSIWRETSWDAWWEAVADLDPYVRDIAARAGKTSTSLATSRNRMRRAFPTLGLRRLADGERVSAASIQRRFGALLGTLWRWTFDTPTLDVADAFPWRRWESRPLPSAARVLDMPLSVWDHLAPLLRDDLDRLRTPGERVLRIEWRLTVDTPSHPGNDGYSAGHRTDLTVPVTFRHPHDLEAERGEHGTTLAQAEHAFLDAARSFIPPGRDDLELDRLNVLGWTVSIVETMPPTPRVAALFDRSGDSLAELIAVENRVAIPLTRYDARDDWTLDGSWSPDGTSADPSAADSPPGESWQALFRARPLFLTASPRTVDAPPPHVTSHVERTMARWWENPTREHARDFFRATVTINKYPTRVFLERDPLTNEWTLRGVYS